ncbi:MAG: c-type cytochrome [Magnetococcus sp. DMHC-6]
MKSNRQYIHYILFILIFLQAWIIPIAHAEEKTFSPIHAFKKYCASCHGEKGDGKSNAAQGLIPPPRNFTDPKALVDLTREKMLHAVQEGKTGTAMVAWKSLFTPKEIELLVDYIRDTLMASSRAGDASPGRRIFADYCSVCHGDKGDTAIWARNGLTPSPRNFTTDQARKELSLERMLFSVTYGRPNTAMPAWGERLSKEEIQQVIDYIRKAFLFPEGEAETLAKMAAKAPATQNQGHQHQHFDTVEMARPMPLGMVGDVAWGEEFYNHNCADCHGKEGNGKGVRSDFIFPKPRDFTHPSSTHKFNREHLFDVVTNGMPHTEMSAWGKVLNRQEIANVVEYIFQTFITPRLPTGFLDEARSELLQRKPLTGHHSHAHPGMPMAWIWPIIVFMTLVSLWALATNTPTPRTMRTINLIDVPGLGGLVRYLNKTPQPLAMMKLLSVTVFILIIIAGIIGSQWPERNFATVIVWGLWWPLVIISVFFFGSAWCAICPWETLSKLLVFQKLWRRPAPSNRPIRKVPPLLRNVWGALFLFVGLTWLELGVGVTTIPMATALMALLMLILAVIGLLLYERKAFCRYFCPVGRTIGYYSRLAPIEVRPLNDDICAKCTTMECYNGTKDLEPCPTHLTLGRFAQNTFCLSCGSCVLSCPHRNASWRLRPMASEATDNARPHWDGSWFMLGLLGLTIFHGITMVSFWQQWINTLSGWLGETGKPLISFTILLWLFFFLPALVYGIAIKFTQWQTRTKVPYRTLFSRLAFITLPLAFTYHLAHNLDHLIGETAGLGLVLANPLGIDTLPMTAMERMFLMEDKILPSWAIFTIQAGLITLGFWLAIQIIRHRGRNALESLENLKGFHLLPLIVFACIATGFNLWLLAQDMTMRM